MNIEYFLFMLVVVFQPTVCQLPCVLETPANYKEWSNTQTEEVVTWDVSKVCSSYKGCYGTEGPSTIQQLKPILTQNGALIEFQSNSKTLVAYKTDEYGFLNCNFINSILVEDMSNVHVTTGNNYFIANDTEKPWNKCKVGLRVNISLTASACSATADETPCNGRGKCLTTNHQSSFRCICCESYVGDYCEKLNGCYSSNNLCLNGGDCIDGPDTSPSTSLYSCACTEGFTGKNCEKEDVGSCKRNECMNGGTCEEDKSETNEFQCHCAPGFEGQVCENEINECASAPCLNGGKCQDGVNKFTCVCSEGFEGERCEIDKRPCKPGTCKNGGTCDESNGSAVCFCGIGFGGTDCSKKIMVSCSLCENAKQCNVYSNGTYSCVCHYGFYGEHCESKINTSNPSCASNPCIAMSRCEERESGYMCRCDDGTLKLKCNDTIKKTLSSPDKTTTAEQTPVYIFVILAIIISVIILALIILLIICFRRKILPPPFQPYSISGEVQMKDLKNSKSLSSPADCFQDDSFPDESFSISTISSNLSYERSHETPVVKRSVHKNVTA